MVCNLGATLAAAPLMLLGGYRLVGAVSIAVALLQGVLALGLPAAPKVASAQHDPEELAEASDLPEPLAAAGPGGVGSRYLQDVIEGPARATVTSASGLGSEVMALGVFAAFAVGPVVGTIGATMAVLSVLVLGIAAAVPRWLPAETPVPDGDGPPTVSS